MNRERYDELKRALVAARERPPAERAAYLAGLDPALRAEVESLLAADESPPPIVEHGVLSRPLETPASGASAAAPRAPRRIGPYEVLGVLGEGGMGTVYLAQQTHPLRRRVAVKVVRRGLDSRRVMARFESERQALALMEHPHIARVLDAGEDDEGRPYFVMEVVEGVPITRYAEERNLDVPARLELFLEVCSAVQHAHQKGVIHRDLKPTNILVADRHGQPAPKVIDFGIVKALSEPLTPDPALTLPDHVVGTPDYMSPEQAGAIEAPVDTRTDVYALGMILYELLCGARPYAWETSDPGGRARQLRDAEPPRPSARVGAGPRPRGTRERLRRRLAGDLDTIVLMALRREPERRYASVEAFAADLRRHLEGLPVAARPDTWSYRAAKFARRHRAAVTAVAAAIVVLAGYAATLTVNAARIEEQRNRALEAERAARREAETASQIADFLVDLFAVANPSETRGNTITARELLDRGATRIATELRDRPEIQGRLLHNLGDAYYALGLYDRSHALLDSALAARVAALGPDHPDVALTLSRISYVYHDQGDYPAAAEFARRALAIRRKALGETSNEYAESLNDLAVSLQAMGRVDEAEPLYRRALEIHRRVLGSRDPQVAWDLSTLGQVLHARADYAGAEAMLREALAIQRDTLGPTHFDVAHTLNNLGGALLEQGRTREAEQVFREALGVCETLYGDDHASVARARHNLGLAVRELGRPREAETLFRVGLAGYREHLGAQHPYVARALANLGLSLQDQGRLAEAERALREALTLRVERLGADHRETSQNRYLLAEVLREAGRPREAETLDLRALAGLRAALGGAHPDVGRTLTSLALLRLARGDRDSALALARQGFELLARRLPATHWKVAEARSALGACLAAAGRRDEARAALETALRDLRASLGEANRLARATATRLAAPRPA